MCVLHMENSHRIGATMMANGKRARWQSEMECEQQKLKLAKYVNRCEDDDECKAADTVFRILALFAMCVCRYLLVYFVLLHTAPCVLVYVCVCVCTQNIVQREFIAFYFFPYPFDCFASIHLFIIRRFIQIRLKCSVHRIFIDQTTQNQRAKENEGE